MTLYPLGLGEAGLTHPLHYASENATLKSIVLDDNTARIVADMTGSGAAVLISNIEF